MNKFDAPIEQVARSERVPYLKRSVTSRPPLFLASVTTLSCPSHHSFLPLYLSRLPLFLASVTSLRCLWLPPFFLPFSCLLKGRNKGEAKEQAGKETGTSVNLRSSFGIPSECLRDRNERNNYRTLIYPITYFFIEIWARYWV